MVQVSSVLIADDHALYREGLREIIGRWEDFSVVGEAQDGREAVELCRLHHPDLVLMDVRMPGMDGISALSVISRECPSTVVVMLSVHESEREVIAAIRAGARGYVLKNTYAKQLHQRLRRVMDGSCTLSEEAAARCVAYIRESRSPEIWQSPNDAAALNLLTEHERQLLGLIAMGASNREIGERLFISESTVKKQISFMLTKLGLSNRVQAAVFALRSGLAE